MTAVGALEAGESGGQITTAIELVDDIHGIGSKRAVGFSMNGFVFGQEIVP